MLRPVSRQLIAYLPRHSADDEAKTYLTPKYTYVFKKNKKKIKIIQNMIKKFEVIYIVRENFNLRDKTNYISCLKI